MADPRIQPPPFNLPLFDDRGVMTLPWQLWFLKATAVIATGSAPADAEYWVSQANALLTNERNIGLLASGYLKIVTALGIATPSTVTVIPTADLTGTLQAAQEPAHTGDVTNAAGSLVLALVNIPALDGSALFNLTGTNVDHGTARITFADTPYNVPAGVEVVLVNATGGAVTVNLPGPTSGRMTAVKKIDASANAVTVDGGAGNIDAGGTVVLAAQWDSVMVDSDGADYFILAQV